MGFKKVNLCENTQSNYQIPEKNTEMPPFPFQCTFHNQCFLEWHSIAKSPQVPFSYSGLMKAYQQAIASTSNLNEVRGTDILNIYFPFSWNKRFQVSFLPNIFAWEEMTSQGSQLSVSKMAMYFWKRLGF